MVHNGLDNYLSGFEPIGLGEIESLSLMNRKDRKYVLTMGQLGGLFADLQGFCKVLEIEGKRMSRYETYYFDTEDFELYRQHHCGWANRYKVRFRKYVETGEYYFEVKYKNNKKETLKQRVLCAGNEREITEVLRDFLLANTDLNPDVLSLQLLVEYSRITLVNFERKFRLTLDVGLRFSRGVENIISYPNIVICEVKEERGDRRLGLGRWLENRGLRRCSVSKYCLGIVALNEGVRSNNFKKEFQLIEGLGKGYSIKN